MNKALLVLGVVLLALGLAGFYVSWYTTLYQNRTHRGAIPFGGLSVAVLGALIVVGGIMTGRPGAATAGQFKCAKCGAVFGSQAALDQHSKDKHGTQAKS